MDGQAFSDLKEAVKHILQHSEGVLWQWSIQREALYSYLVKTGTEEEQKLLRSGLYDPVKIVKS